MRPITEYDQALYCRLYTDPEVMRHIAAPLSAEAAQRKFAALLPRVRHDAPPWVWVLSERATSGSIGILALISHGDTDGALELGAMLEAEGRNRGLATEALTALVEITFSQWPCYRLWTSHAPGNAAAVGLMLKLGFEPEADGNMDTNRRWQVTRDHWLACRARPAGVAERGGDR